MLDRSIVSLTFAVVVTESEPVGAAPAPVDSIVAPDEKVRLLAVTDPSAMRKIVPLAKLKAPPTVAVEVSTRNDPVPVIVAAPEMLTAAPPIRKTPPDTATEVGETDWPAVSLNVPALIEIAPPSVTAVLAERFMPTLVVKAPEQENVPPVGAVYAPPLKLMLPTLRLPFVGVVDPELIVNRPVTVRVFGMMSKSVEKNAAFCL